MMHSTLYQELMSEQRDQSAMIENGDSRLEVASCVRQVSVPGTSSQGATEPTEGKLVTFWASSRLTEELSQLQKEDPDIGPIISAKLSGSRPSSKEMVTFSQLQDTTGSYGIHL